MGEIISEEAEREAIRHNWAQQSHRAHELGIKLGAGAPYEEGQKSTDENPRSLGKLAEDLKGILDAFESQKNAAQATVAEAEKRHDATRFIKE